MFEVAMFRAISLNRGSTDRTMACRQSTASYTRDTNVLSSEVRLDCYRAKDRGFIAQIDASVSCIRLCTLAAIIGIREPLSLQF